MNYSTTYIAEIVKLLSVVGLILGFEVDADQLMTVLGIAALIASQVYSLWLRYQLGGINAFGIKKK